MSGLIDKLRAIAETAYSRTRARRDDAIPVVFIPTLVPSGVSIGGRASINGQQVAHEFVISFLDLDLANVDLVTPAFDTVERAIDALAASSTS